MMLDNVSLVHTARLGPATLWRFRPWRAGHVLALRPRRAKGNQATDDAAHIAAAARWLARAQDESGDGGIVGRYRLDRGWTSSYPETTGYIVPTFLALAERLDSQFLARAARCIEFLLSVQLPNGAFPALEIAENRTYPSPFNTAQIIHGLLAWHRRSMDASCADAAMRAGEWLVSIQDDDGAWRRFFYLDTPACYSAYLSCWLAELGAAFGEDRFLRAAERHVNWVMTHLVPSNGWFDRTGFLVAEQTQRVANLHAIAYALGGLQRSALTLGRPDVMDAVARGAAGIARTSERLGWLPGVLDWEWRARADSVCLTGNAQMALVWMELHRQTRDEAWLAPAFAALAAVKDAQLLSAAHPDLHGAVPGSAPIWGSYMSGRLLSWAAKFLIDALHAKTDLTAGTQP